MLPLPEKPQSVIKFEKMGEKAKAKVRESTSEWPEIAKYYIQYHDTIANNIGEHLWLQKSGQEPRGLISYTCGSFIDNRDPCPNWEIPEWVTNWHGRRRKKTIQIYRQPGEEG